MFLNITTEYLEFKRVRGTCLMQNEYDVDILLFLYYFQLSFKFQFIRFVIILASGLLLHFL